MNDKDSVPKLRRENVEGALAVMVVRLMQLLATKGLLTPLELNSLMDTIIHDLREDPAASEWASAVWAELQRAQSSM